jgi:Mrp family chromosome partitioning ATPase
VVVATSAGTAEGKTTVTVVLASAFALQGYRTLLVDLDLRRPMIAELLGVSAAEARVHRVLAEPDGELVVHTITLDEHTGLDVIPAIAGLDRPG